MNVSYPTDTKAMFLDLDTVVIQTASGQTFPRDINDWKLRDNVVRKIDMYRRSKYLPIFLITKDTKLEKLNLVIRELESRVEEGEEMPWGVYTYPNAQKADYEWGIDITKSILVSGRKSAEDLSKRLAVGRFIPAGKFLGSSFAVKQV